MTNPPVDVLPAAFLHDEITGLANRPAWDRALAAEERRCRRYGQNVSVIVVDVDHLEAINESRGHSAGDEVLRRVARSLEHTSRESDVMARTGSDEFALLALDCGEPCLRVLVARVRRSLAEAGVEASVGGACRVPGTGLLDAWARADAAMYADKEHRHLGHV